MVFSGGCPVQFKCGDGVVTQQNDGVNEECDDGNQNSDVVPDACRTDCRLPRCGDGVKDLALKLDGQVANFGVGDDPTGVTAADLNQDGRLDLVAANGNASNVSVLLGNGVGGFAPAVSFDVGVGPTDVAVGDLNQDGHLDLIAANRVSDNVSVLLGDGAGNFAAPVNFAVRDEPIDVAAADLNQDGHLDLIATNLLSNNVSVLLLFSEECDDGGSVTGDGCNAQCRVGVGFCGDGIVEAPEQCDDGNTQSGDGCSAQCQTEASSCGNSIVEAPEECDDGNQVNTDACTNICKTAVCGDGFVRAGLEQCDDGNQVDTDACKNNCTTNAAALFDLHVVGSNFTAQGEGGGPRLLVRNPAGQTSLDELLSGEASFDVTFSDVLDPSDTWTAFWFFDTNRDNQCSAVDDLVSSAALTLTVDPVELVMSGSAPNDPNGCAQFPEEICDNNLDDDNNNLIDCADTDDCANAADVCIEVTCNDNQDNDGDSLFDCADPDCTSNVACLPNLDFRFLGIGFLPVTGAMRVKLVDQSAQVALDQTFFSATGNFDETIPDLLSPASTWTAFWFFDANSDGLCAAGVDKMDVVTLSTLTNPVTLTAVAFNPSNPAACAQF